jgi:hypothetical protein
MPPYYSDCITYYSPVAGMWQILYAFGAGLITAAIMNHLSEKPDPDGEPMNVEQLRQELKLAQGQRDRAFNVIAVLLVGLWICGVFLALHHGIGNGSLSDKTEL